VDNVGWEIGSDKSKLWILQSGAALGLFSIFKRGGNVSVVHGQASVGVTEPIWINGLMAAACRKWMTERAAAAQFLECAGVRRWLRGADSRLIKVVAYPHCYLCHAPRFGLPW
jgi:hypothetical protein